MPCLVDIPGRPALSEGKGGMGLRKKRGGNEKLGGEKGGETTIRM